MKLDLITNKAEKTITQNGKASNIRTSPQQE